MPPAVVPGYVVTVAKAGHKVTRGMRRRLGHGSGFTGEATDCKAFVYGKVQSVGGVNVGKNI